MMLFAIVMQNVIYGNESKRSCNMIYESLYEIIVNDNTVHI